VFGQDYWPYGIEANRRTIEAFVQHCVEQGVTTRKIQVQEFFARELSKFVRT